MTGVRRLRSVPGLSVASLLALAVLVVTTGSLVATGAVALRAGERGTDEVVRDRLGSVRATRANQLASYLRRTQVETAALATSGTAAAAMERFATAYRGLAEDGSLAEADEQVLRSFYADEFLPELARVPGAEMGLDTALPGFGAGAYLQRYYLAEPRAESRDTVGDAGDGSEWSAVHAELHPVLRNFADQLGYGDLYLVEPEQLAIVYSVRKAPDFATRLDLGPYSGTALAGVVTEVMRDLERCGAGHRPRAVPADAQPPGGVLRQPDLVGSAAGRRARRPAAGRPDRPHHDRRRRVGR